MDIIQRLVLSYTEEEWSQLSQQERNEYLKKHPNSKYNKKETDAEKRMRYQRLQKEAENNSKHEKELSQHYKKLLDKLNHD